MGQRYPQYLFDHNPPQDEHFAREVFHDREGELEFGINLLSSATTFSKIYAVHGMTRCGKSHLVHRMLADVREKALPFQVFSVNANSRGTARAVLDELFFVLRDAINSFERSAVPDGWVDTLETAVVYLEEVEPLIAEESSEIALGRTKQTMSGLLGGLKLAPPPFGLTAGGKLELREGLEEKWTRRAPSDRNLVELLNYECHLLSQLRADEKVLLFVDDLDLLDQPDSPGQKEANRLVGLLKMLAEKSYIVVLTTMRHSYFNGREKDFKDFIKVSTFDSRGLEAVYRKHIELYNDGEQVFSREALRFLERSASGRVGMFLHRCYQLWREFGAMGKRVGLRELRKFIRTDIEELRSDPEHWPVIAALEQAVRQEKQQLEYEGDLRSSGMLFTVLDPIPGTTNAYNINPLYAEEVKRIQRGDE